jgi:RPA family protein
MEQQLRQTAYKVWISDLLNKKLQKEEGEWTPNYILIDNKKVSRVNIIATVVMKTISEDKNYATLTIDDSSSDIQIKAWKEDVPSLENIEIGDTVLVVGKIREYNSQIYLTHEIIRPLEKKEWIDLRKKELASLYGQRETQEPKIQETPKEETREDKQPSIVIEEVVDSESNVRQKILNTIGKLDKAEGADITEVLEDSKIDEEEANSAIQELLKEGEIFEIKAGRLKIIE